MAKWNDKNTKYRYELVIEDDAFESRRVASVASKLINRDNARAILSVYSLGANIISPVAAKAKVIHIACAVGPLPADGQYNFNNHTQSDKNAAILVSKLKSDGVKTISLFTQNAFVSLQQSEALAELLRKEGFTILSDENFNTDIRDFSMMIEKSLRKGTPDIFYFNGWNPADVIFIKNLQTIVGKANVTTINDFSGYEDKTPFNELWFVESAYGTDKFKQEFKLATGHEILTCGANIYDSLDMLIWAFENTAAENETTVPDNADVVEKLRSVKNWSGAIGEISIDASGIMQSTGSVKFIENGRSISLGK
jgi:ABC-type branched-subunit amino acid transport system substrate-binding protein